MPTVHALWWSFTDQWHRQSAPSSAYPNAMPLPALSISRSPSSTELLRENKRMPDKSMREIERERQGLQAQEKKSIVQINNTAEQGQMVARGHIEHLGNMKHMLTADLTQCSCISEHRY